jgi:hypothetical protein
MAGKKKSTNDEGLGKTARASALKKGGKKEGFIAAAPEKLDRVISLAGGEYLYLLDPRNGRTKHLRTGSVDYNNFVDTLIQDADHGQHIRAELTRKGFPIPEVAEELV